MQYAGIFLVKIAAAQQMRWDDVVELTTKWERIGKSDKYLPKDANRMSLPCRVFLHAATECDRFAVYIERTLGFPVDIAENKTWEALEQIR